MKVLNIVLVCAIGVVGMLGCGGSGSSGSATSTSTSGGSVANSYAGIFDGSAVTGASPSGIGIHLEIGTTGVISGTETIPPLNGTGGSTAQISGNITSAGVASLTVMLNNTSMTGSGTLTFNSAHNIISGTLTAPSTPQNVTIAITAGQVSAGNIFAGTYTGNFRMLAVTGSAQISVAADGTINGTCTKTGSSTFSVGGNITIDGAVTLTVTGTPVAGNPQTGIATFDLSNNGELVINASDSGDDETNIGLTRTAGT